MTIEVQFYTEQENITIFYRLLWTVVLKIKYGF